MRSTRVHPAWKAPRPVRRNPTVWIWPASLNLGLIVAVCLYSAYALPAVSQAPAKPSRPGPKAPAKDRVREEAPAADRPQAEQPKPPERPVSPTDPWGPKEARIPAPGEVWRLKPDRANPAEKGTEATIREIRQGWVRYSLGADHPDERDQITWFVERFQPVGSTASAAP